MRAVRKRGSELASGDVLRTWYGDHTILDVLPYTGPFDFPCGIAHMPCADMTIDRNGLYEVLLPD
ncbi:hypothetical protein B0G76_8417 [Paraburkholderia sp. BL23I1N1]|uniref:hypothetical protein n=1 Tax=Paraburkholderia sp. BL23I1N1 TaxID=1938802 RepID=UPI000E762301|nr:hypothetical protein [Paraburkholderia sp. BL23I1N1]RKE23737.1 hypothetical protein B0G76_8417 [Paraburkholderia sp. BL23I1N1]